MVTGFLSGWGRVRGAHDEVGHLLCACDLALALCGMSLHSYLVSLVIISLRRARFFEGWAVWKVGSFRLGRFTGSSFSVILLQASLSSHFKLKHSYGLVVEWVLGTYLLLSQCLWNLHKYSEEIWSAFQNWNLLYGFACARMSLDCVQPPLGRSLGRGWTRLCMYVTWLCPTSTGEESRARLAETVHICHLTVSNLYWGGVSGEAGRGCARMSRDRVQPPLGRSLGRGWMRLLL